LKTEFYPDYKEVLKYGNTKSRRELRRMGGSQGW